MESLLSQIKKYEEQFLTRKLQLPSGEDFSSNDYLGFATDLILRAQILRDLSDIPSGSTGSRLLRGHSQIVQDLENVLAQFSEREAALYFPSGYQANLALLSAVLKKNSVVFSDEQNHASLIDGMRLAGCEKRIFRHNQVSHLRHLLEAIDDDAHKVIVVERIYSMSGERAPLSEIFLLAQEFNAQVIIDEAHTTGLEAPAVSECPDPSLILATMHSAGKALGVSGAWVASDEVIKNYLIQFSRPFIYSTAPSPLLMRAVQSAVEYWQEMGGSRRHILQERCHFFKSMAEQLLERAQWTGEGPIFFIELGESQKALSSATRLQELGFDVRAIRYPTVAEGHAGLRVSIHANHSESLIRKLVQSIANEFYQ